MGKGSLRQRLGLTPKNKAKIATKSPAKLIESLIFREKTKISACGCFREPKKTVARPAIKTTPKLTVSIKNPVKKAEDKKKARKASVEPKKGLTKIRTFSYSSLKSSPKVSPQIKKRKTLTGKSKEVKHIREEISVQEKQYTEEEKAKKSKKVTEEMNTDETFLMDNLMKEENQIMRNGKLQEEVAKLQNEMDTYERNKVEIKEKMTGIEKDFNWEIKRSETY